MLLKASTNVLEIAQKLAIEEHNIVTINGDNSLPTLSSDTTQTNKLAKPNQASAVLVRK